MVIRPAIIQSSRLRVASFHIVWTGLALIWPILYGFSIHPANHIGSFFKAIFALCALASGVIALNEGRKAWRVLITAGDWKATISANRLIWEVAIPSENLPIDVALSDIAKATRLEISRTGRDSDGEHTEVQERFELHFVDGRVIDFDRETAGINPHRVFLALAEHGTDYEFWTQDDTKDSIDRSKVFQRSY